MKMCAIIKIFTLVNGFQLCPNGFLLTNVNIKTRIFVTKQTHYTTLNLQDIRIYFQKLSESHYHKKLNSIPHTNCMHRLLWQSLAISYQPKKKLCVSFNTIKINETRNTSILFIFKYTFCVKLRYQKIKYTFIYYIQWFSKY